MNEFNAVVFAAVSTKVQAEDDKFSIPNQIAESRKWIESNHVREIHAPLVVNGNTREYIRLEHAERDIPEIKLMFELARSGTINLVVLYSYHRWRNIMIPIQMTLAAYSCQTYSLTDGGNLLPPSEFTPYANDAATMTIGLANMMSRLDINRLRRYYFTGMPKRVTELGIHYNNNFPYGYKRPDHIKDIKEYKRAIPIQIDAQCAILNRMKNEYLAGASAEEIALHLSTDGIVSPGGNKKWYGTTVLSMLSNPFYAGLVHHGGIHQRRDPLTGKVKRTKGHPQTLRQGKHVPVWDEETYYKLIQRRKEVNQNLVGKTRLTRLFSRLLSCDECGAHLRAQRYYDKNDQIAYRCVDGGHIYILERFVFEQLRENMMRFANEQPPLATDENTDLNSERRRLETQLHVNDEKRARCQRAYTDGAFTLDDMKARLAEIASERAETEKRLAVLNENYQQASRKTNKQEIVSRLRNSLDKLRLMPANEANAALSDVIREIRIRGKTITDIRFR